MCYLLATKIKYMVECYGECIPFRAPKLYKISECYENTVYFNSCTDENNNKYQCNDYS